MTLFSEAVTAELEAFIYWLLKVCYVQWVNQWQQDHRDESDKRAKQVRTKPKGKKNFADAHLEEYLEMLKEVQQARKEELTGLAWDRAVQSKLQEGAKRGSGLVVEGNGGSNRPIKKKRIVPVPGFQLPGNQAAV